MLRFRPIALQRFLDFCCDTPFFLDIFSSLYRIDRTKALDYLLCRGDDEISTLAKEFSDMITGLGRRGSAAGTKSLTGGSGYPDNPFTVKFVRPPPTAPFSSITDEY